MTFEQALIYAFLASPFMLCILVLVLMFSAGPAFVFSVGVAAVGAWFARGWKEDLDRDYRAQNWKFPP